MGTSTRLGTDEWRTSKSRTPSRRRLGATDEEDMKSGQLDLDEPPSQDVPNVLSKAARAGHRATVQHLQSLAKIAEGQRKGHWRKLGPGQTGKTELGTPSPDKTWVRGYLGAMAALAPAVAVKGLVDIPKAGIEGALESKIRQKPIGLKKILGGAGGRYIGGTVGGILTAPVFFSGIKDLQSDDRKTRKKGLAKVLVAGSILPAIKGATEALGGQSGKVGGRAAGRMISNLPALALLAAGAAKGAKEKDTKKKYLWGALGGAAGGLAKGIGEVAIEERRLYKADPKAFKRALLGRGMGRTVAGVIGGLALTAVIDKLVPKKKVEAATGSQKVASAYQKRLRRGLKNRLAEGEQVIPGLGTQYTTVPPRDKRPVDLYVTYTDGFCQRHWLRGPRGLRGGG